MLIKFISLGGYGFYVWPAFIFTFLSCLFLYIKTKKELKKQEKIFLRYFKVIETIKVEKPRKKEELAEKVLSIKPTL